MNKILRTLFTFFLFGSIISSAHALDLKSSNAVNDTSSQNFLDVNDAFEVKLIEGKGADFRINFNIADGYYLYKKRIDVKVSQPFNIREISFPKADLKNDPNFGPSEVFHKDFTLPVSLRSDRASPNPPVVEVLYQGCSEKGLCYPPMSKKFKLASFAQEPLTIKNDGLKGSSEDKSIDLLKKGNFWLIALGFFGFGLLLSLTPCVFPMIPILSGIIVGQGNHSKMGSFNLSLAYVLGMAMSYTVAGVLAALTGTMISNALQNPWILGVFSLVFVALALSMFGFYELQLPPALVSKLSDRTNRIKGGQFTGIFFMGALSALIVSPCVAAPLAGALIYIGQTHDVVMGGLALFLLSLGMGVPLLLIGASAGALLPKAGKWMDSIKHFFGIMMLGVAIWIASPLIPHYFKLFLVSGLLIVSSIYLGALESLKDHSPDWGVVKKGIGVLLLALGMLILFTSLNEAGVIPKKEFDLNVTQNEETNGLIFKGVKSVQDLGNEIKKSPNEIVMLDFYADWCAACKEFETGPFKDPKIKKNLDAVKLLQADVTANNEADKELMRKFNLFGPPGIIFLNKQGEVIYKVVGYQDSKEFDLSINKAKSYYKQKGLNS